MPNSSLSNRSSDRQRALNADPAELRRALVAAQNRGHVALVTRLLLALPAPPPAVDPAVRYLDWLRDEIRNPRTPPNDPGQPTNVDVPA